MMKRFALLLLCLLIIIPVASAQALTVGLVLDTADVMDQSFNQNAWEGLQRAEAEFGLEVLYLPSESSEDYRANIDALVADGCDLVICAGYLMADELEEAAVLHPGVQFACIDASYENTQANLIGITFREEEAGFLAGYIAGKMTETDQIGFLSGMTVPAVVAYQWGYYAGALYANETVEWIGVSIDSFTKGEVGGAMAENLYELGPDIIFFCGGATATGGIAKANEMGRFCIGADVDQSHLAPDTMLTSAMKRVDEAVLSLCRSLSTDSLAGGNYVYGLAEGMVGLPLSTKNLVSEELWNEVEAVKLKIAAGEITVPRTREQAEAMGIVAP